MSELNDLSQDDVVASWLDEMLNNEADLRPSRGVDAEKKRGKGIPRIIIQDGMEPIAYAELRRVGRAIELATVVVNPPHRGKGYCHQIVHQAWERWRQDPIVHGQLFTPDVDISQAIRSDSEVSRSHTIRGPLISFTRDAAMAAALTGGGFTLLPRKRRGSRLWLWKSDFAALPLSIQINLMFDRLGRGLRMLFTSPRRLPHFIRHARDYRLFARIPEDAERRPPRLNSRPERENIQRDGVAVDVIDQLEVVGYSQDRDELGLDTINAWDEGE